VLGDDLLISVSCRLNSIIRSSDTIARLGGDEFAMLIEEIDHEADAVRTAQRIQDALSMPFDVGGHEIFTTVSIGIALSTSGYQRAHDVLRDADIAMYRAKSRGKARHELFDTAMHERALTRLEFETDLRRAIERGELRVYYQPIVSMLTGKLLGFEALVRWQRGDELISAEEIVAVAEETGLIVPIGEWVLREALRQVRAWSSMNGALDIHVNLSARQLLHPNVVDRVTDALAESGVDPRRLQLEVTESVLIDSAETAAALLRSLRDVQVGLSLDDFGTGYSSLNYVRRFPVDILKVDKSFIDGVTEGGESSALTAAVIELASILNLKPVAEGIERADQLEQLIAMKCDLGQGFLFAKPLPTDELEDLLTEHIAMRLEADALADRSD
jgi:predicted signal transduction protein with EAL and GGDEF domain